MSPVIVQCIRQSLYRHAAYCVAVQGGHLKHFLYLRDAINQKLCFGRPIFLIVFFIASFHRFMSSRSGHAFFVLPILHTYSIACRVFAVCTCLSIHAQNTYHLYRMCRHISIPLYTYQNCILQYSLYEIPPYLTVCACSTVSSDINFYRPILHSVGRPLTFK